MTNTDCPIQTADDTVNEREEDYESLVHAFGWYYLLCLFTICEPDIGQENCIGYDSSDNEDILDDDPGGEGGDTNSNCGAGGDGGHQEGRQGEEEGHQEGHAARDNLEIMKEGNTNWSTALSAIPEGWSRKMPMKWWHKDH